MFGIDYATKYCGDDDGGSERRKGAQNEVEAIAATDQQAVVHDLEPAQKKHVLRQLVHQLRHAFADPERAAEVHVLEGFALELPRKAKALVHHGAAVDITGAQI